MKIRLHRVKDPRGSRQMDMQACPLGSLPAGIRIFFLLTCITIFSAFSAAGCSRSSSTAENASPETLYASDNDIDMFIYEGTAYVNALDVDWVGELSLAKGEKLGTISRSDVTDDFQDWDATILPEGTAVYKSGESQVLLAETEDALIPYLKYAEG